MRKHVKARRARNLELGKKDAANRCRFCKRRLPKHPWVLFTDTLEELAYCNIDCRRDDCDARGEGF